MSLPVRFTQEAANDLEEIWTFIARDNPEAADRLNNEFALVLEMIASSPRMGRARDALRVGLRSHPHGNYIIFYACRRDAIEVMRVLHAARDMTDLFP